SQAPFASSSPTTAPAPARCARGWGCAASASASSGWARAAASPPAAARGSRSRWRSPVDEIRVLIADDQALFRGGLALLLGVQPRIAVVGEAADGEEALRLAATSRPDVVLMDLRMPVLDGVAAIAR